VLFSQAIQCRILAALLAGQLPADFSREPLEVMYAYFFEVRKDMGERVVDSRGRRQTGNRWALSPQEQAARQAQPGVPR
jgi:hypothetical protein